MHRREWVLQQNALTVRDRIEGQFREAIGQFHFHPAVKLERKADAQSGTASLATGRKIEWQVTNRVAGDKR